MCPLIQSVQCQKRNVEKICGNVASFMLLAYPLLEKCSEERKARDVGYEGYVVVLFGVSAILHGITIIKLTLLFQLYK